MLPGEPRLYAGDVLTESHVSRLSQLSAVTERPTQKHGCQDFSFHTSALATHDAR
jgi:hypothetical protein